MAEIITMPKLGFDMQEGTLANWVKNLGDAINTGDILVEVETDKATVEVEAFTSGTILKLLAEPGDIVAVGAPIAIVGKPGEDISGMDAGSAPIAAPIIDQDEGLSQTAPAVPESDLTQTEAAQEIGAGESDDVDGSLPGGVKASPLARRMAKERGIDLRHVRGTGPGGRVVKEDIENFKPGATPATPAAAPAKAPAATPAPARGAAAGLGAAPTYAVMDDIAHEVIPTSRLRATIARRMVESKQFVPHFTVTTAMDTTELLNLRKQINARLPEESQVTVNDLIVKAAAIALRDFPNLNTHYHGDTLIRYKDINIGIAVALPQGGLINVVAKKADSTSLSVMAKKNKTMIAAAREGKVKPEDIEGSTFTVSNLGAYGVEHFTAIINPPEAGILAIGASQKVPVVNKDGQIVIGNVMKVTIAVDHRVSDGAEGAQYMQRFKALIEDPMGLLV